MDRSWLTPRGAWRRGDILPFRPAAPRAQGGGRAGKSVLVVEDDAFARRAMEQILRGHGYAVRGAADGRAALAAARADRPDVILLDLVMPVADGWEVCRRLARDPGLAAIPVVVVSAAEREEAPGRAAAYLRKPVTAEQLLEAVRQC